MRLQNISAEPHPYGNRVDLKWENPEPDAYPQVRVVRRTGAHPLSPEDGHPVTQISAFLFEYDLSITSDLDHRFIPGDLVQRFLDNGIILSKNSIISIETAGSKWVIADGEQRYILRVVDDMIHAYRKGLDTVADENLKSETIYYYTLFPFKNDPPGFVFDRYNRTAAMASGPYNMAGQMYRLLPGIYHRYDTVLSEKVADQDREKGELRRFLDVPGSLLDQFHSFAKAILDVYNLDRVDGRLLPLLAQWIGWKTDFSQEIASQRNEIRNAPALYKKIGLIPTVEATVKRMSGWESSTKEFVHNVFLSNRPARLNLWAKARSSSGAWSEPNQPLSLDFAYEGRPAGIEGTDHNTWFFYHTCKKRQWKEDKTCREVYNIWYKKQSVFPLSLELMTDLNNLDLSPQLKQAFQDADYALSPHASIALVEPDSMWVVEDATSHQSYTVISDGAGLRGYAWEPSKPLTNRLSIDKYPTSAAQGDTLWVWWSVYDEQNHLWHIEHRTRSGEEWSEIIRNNEPFGNLHAERKRPLAITDNDGGLWLFWLERTNTQWQMKYNRHDGTDWQLDTPAEFSMDADTMEDSFILFNLTDATLPLYVFWARRESAGDPNRMQWTIAYRVKQSLDPTVIDWGPVHLVPKNPPDALYHDREPVAFVFNEHVELFWSSNRNGSWSIWGLPLQDIESAGVVDAREVTNGPYSQRDPFPLVLETGSMLVYRSNQDVTYTSSVYKATQTSDYRYAGSTTCDTGNIEKISRYGKIDDFQTYTYDTGKKDEDWYARDTIGLYLKNDTMDKGKINAGVDRVKKVLHEFMPLTDRAVFIPQQDEHTERVYTYGLPLGGQSRFINESYEDHLTNPSAEVIPGPGDDVI